MSPTLWIPLLVALGCAATPDEAAATPADVWLDVAPALLAAAASGDASRAWPGDEIAALDDAGRLHLIVREEGRVRVLTGELGVSLPARLLVADAQQRVIGSEVYAIGARGDVWQAQALPTSGTLQIARMTGELPADARAVVTGEFKLNGIFAQFLVVDASGGYSLWRIDDSSTLRREALDLDLPPATSLLAVDRSLERAIVFGRGWVDGLVLVAESGQLWCPQRYPEHGPDDGMAPYAEDVGRLLCWDAPREGRTGIPWLFEQHTDGRVRFLGAAKEAFPAALYPVFSSPERILVAIAPERLSASGDPTFWTLDASSALRRSTLLDASGERWITEVVREGPTPAVGVFEIELEDEQRPDGTRLVAAWGSRLVDLGAP